MSAVKNADLCWGQRYMWLKYHQLPPDARRDAHIVLTFRINENQRITLPALRSMLSYLARRHEALRTTYHLDDGPWPRQRVHPPAVLPLVLVTAERDGTASPAEVVDRLTGTEFDLSTEWPVRACVITSGGAPQQLVLVLNHVAFDAWAVDELEREINALGAGAGAGRPAAMDPVRHQPVDLARHEASPGALAAKDRAMAYWRDEVAALPSDTFAARRRRVPALVRSATLTSPALLAAVRRIAARHRVWPSLVHITAHNLLTAAYTGHDTVAYQAFTSNRELAPFTDTMTCMFSPNLMRVDCHDDPPFSELLRRTEVRSELARDNSYFPYDELVELRSAEGFRRGHEVRVGSELNFVTYPHRVSRVRRTTFTWNPSPTAWAHYGSDVYLRIHEWSDTVVLALNAVSTVMDDEAMEWFLRGYEALLLTHDIDSSTDLRASELSPPALPAEPPAVSGAAEVPFVAVASPSVEALPPVVVVAGAAESALVAAVRRVNGLDGVTPSDSYTSAGGRALRIPRVLAELATEGWNGLRVDDLASARPLRVLAAALAPCG